MPDIKTDKRGKLKPYIFTETGAGNSVKPRIFTDTGARKNAYSQKQESGSEAMHIHRNRSEIIFIHRNRSREVKPCIFTETGVGK